MFAIKSWEIERLFKQDSSSKKRTGNSVYKRASRRGYIRGGVKTASDFMTKKEIRELNGEIKVMNKYDYSKLEDVPSYKEFLDSNDVVRQNILKSCKEKFTYKGISKYWGITRSTYQSLLYKYKIMERGKLDFFQSLIRHTRTDEKLRELSWIPSLSDLSLRYTNEECISIMHFIFLKYTDVQLKNYFQVSSSTISRIKQRLKELNPQKLGEDDIRNIVKSGYSKTKNTTVEEPTKEETIKEVVENKEEVNSNVEVEEINKKLKIQETDKKLKIDKIYGMQYSLNGVYEKTELKQLIPPTIGIMIDNKKYEISIEIKEVIE